jgi:spermidine/putrescine transport system permease protein
MSEAVVVPEAAGVEAERAEPGARTGGRFGEWLANPWGRPRVLALFTLLYLIWSLAPVALAVLFSFNNGRSRSVWQGFSLQWYCCAPQSVARDPTLRGALAQSLKLSLLTMLIAVPLGVAFAIGVDRWRRRTSTGASGLMLFSFVTPELILGVALFLTFTKLLTLVRLGTSAQLLGLIVFEMAYPFVIVRARLASIGSEYEEAAMDLGASPWRSVRMVLLPLLLPAIFASFVIVFADSIDDFIVVRYLSADASTETIPIQIYSNARGSSTPSLNALASIMLFSTLVAVTIGYLVYRRLTRGERRGGGGLKDFAAQI